MFHGSSPYSFRENDLNAKTRHKSVNRKKVGQVSKLNVGLTLTLQDVCMTQVSWL